MTDKEKYVLSHYKITKSGEIYSNLKFKTKYVKLKYRIDKDGYFDVTLVCNDDGSRQPFRVHRLVALKYINNPNNYDIVNHKDLNKQNNNVENLEWCNVQYNTQHAYDNCAYECVRKVKITLSDGTIHVFPSISHAARYFDYKNATTLDYFVHHNVIPKRGKLCGAKIEYTEESVTTIEKNTSTATGV